MDEKQRPVLIHACSRKYTVNDPDVMSHWSIESQQSLQIAHLLMNMNNIWDAIAFAAEMSATFAYDSDKEGKCYTFTSCETAENYLYKNLKPNQVKNVGKVLKSSIRILNCRWSVTM